MACYNLFKRKNKEEDIYTILFVPYYIKDNQSAYNIAYNVIKQMELEIIDLIGDSIIVKGAREKCVQALFEMRGRANFSLNQCEIKKGRYRGY